MGEASALQGKQDGVGRGGGLVGSGTGSGRYLVAIPKGRDEGCKKRGGGWRKRKEEGREGRKRGREVVMEGESGYER